MKNVCIVDLQKEDEVSSFLKIVKEIKEGIVFLKLFDGVEDSAVEKFIELAHGANKKILLVARSFKFVELVDYIIVYENIPDLEKIIHYSARSGKHFIYKMFSPSFEELDNYKTLIKLSGIHRFITLIASKKENLHELHTCYESYENDLNIVYIDFPPCEAEREGVDVTYRNVLDVSEVIHNGVSHKIETLIHFLSGFVKFSKCSECCENKHCIGMLKEIENKEIFPLEKPSNRLSSIQDLMKRVQNNVSVGFYHYNGKVKAEDSEDVFGQNEIQILQNCRKGDLGNYDFYHIWSFDKSMYFNRHLEPIPLFNHDSRGIDSIDMTFIGGNDPALQHKLKQDLLLPEHGLMILSKVFFKGMWSEERMNALDDFTMSALKEIILENGGEESKLTQKGNDLLYNGKKFCGKEWKFLPPYAYIENTVLTTEYLPEKKWFDMLYHYDGEKQITGITEEVPTVTKELLATELLRKFKEKFNK